jgi:hypothetical protein
MMNKIRKETSNYSINPFLPCYEYIPDGEPRIFGDRVYLYGSHDLFESKSYCSGDYVCWSAPCDNLADWKYEGVIYKRTQDPFIKRVLERGKGNMMNAHMFAPDVIEIEGKYYMYYGVGLSKSGIGVVVSDHPAGPFEYVGRVRYPKSEHPDGWKDGKDGIDDGDMAFGHGKSAPTSLGHYPYDPSVIYDNGRLFMYYGMAYCRVVELDANDKRTVLRNEKTNQYESEVLVPGTLNPLKKGSLKASDTMGMFNGPSIRKIDQTYYLVYYAQGDNHCHAMCYATASSPLGPFKYGGILVSLGDARRGDKKEGTYYTGNVHGGMVEVNGTWYIIYHRHTGIGMRGRQACVAPLNRNPDGTFEHAEFNSQGFSKSALPAYSSWPAYMACHLTDKNGKAKTKSESPFIIQIEYEGGLTDDHSGKEVFQVIRNTTDGSAAGYKHFDFGTGKREGTKVIITMNPQVKGYVDVMADDPRSGECIARVDVVASGGGWKEFEAPLKSIEGIHGIYFVFHPEGKDLGGFSYFTFAY